MPTAISSGTGLSEPIYSSTISTCTLKASPSVKPPSGFRYPEPLSKLGSHGMTRSISVPMWLSFSKAAPDWHSFIGSF
jgi:hypothetical protein